MDDKPANGTPQPMPVGPDFDVVIQIRQGQCGVHAPKHLLEDPTAMLDIFSAGMKAVVHYHWNKQQSKLIVPSLVPPKGIM